MLTCSRSCSQAHEVTSLQIPVKTKLTGNFYLDTKNEATRIIGKNSATISINVTRPIGVIGSTKPTSSIESIDAIEFTSSIGSIHATRIIKTFLILKNITQGVVILTCTKSSCNHCLIFSTLDCK
jgi:hypothetical protein